MLELALRFGNGPVLIKDISRTQDISEKYLERIFFTLKNVRLIKSQRGRKGGYTLAKPPSQIKLIEIIKALEGSLAPVYCVDEPTECKRISICVTRDIWKELRDVIEKTLESVTLADMIKAHKRKNKSKTNMYYI